MKALKEKALEILNVCCHASQSHGFLNACQCSTRKQNVGRR